MANSRLHRDSGQRAALTREPERLCGALLLQFVNNMTPPLDIDINIDTILT